MAKTKTMKTPAQVSPDRAINTEASKAQLNDLKGKVLVIDPDVVKLLIEIISSMPHGTVQARFPNALPYLGGLRTVAKWETFLA